MADVALLDRAFANIMQCFIRTGQAPHHTELARDLGIPLEDAPDEWPDSLLQALNDIIQTDPVQDLDSIGLRLSSTYDDVAGAIDTRWEFLAFDGQPLAGSGAHPANLVSFLSYRRLFYLSSLRDSNDEFAPRS